jgi:hypothetical protein
MDNGERVGCMEKVCFCHVDPWPPGSYPNGCESCGCQRAPERPNDTRRPWRISESGEIIAAAGQEGIGTWAAIDAVNAILARDADAQERLAAYGLQAEAMARNADALRAELAAEQSGYETAMDELRKTHAELAAVRDAADEMAHLLKLYTVHAKQISRAAVGEAATAAIAAYDATRHDAATCPSDVEGGECNCPPEGDDTEAHGPRCAQRFHGMAECTCGVAERAAEKGE